MAHKDRRDIVVIGASAGGLHALRRLMAALPADLNAAIFVVVHIAPESPSILASLLDRAGALPVVQARHGMPLEGGRVVIAPSDHHLMLVDGRVRLSHGPRENRYRPSVDVLFRSAAVAFGPRVIGIVLSGMLDDGSAGLWAVKRRGGLAVVQDPDDAEYPDMPRNAMEATSVDACLSIEEIGRQLAGWTRQPIEAPAVAPSARMASEVAMASEQHIDVEEMDAIGRRTGLTCPECGGSMWEIDESGQPRFRCHVGHAYSMHTMAQEQSTRVESALWAAMRSLEENVRVAERMAQNALQRGEDELAAHHRERSIASSRHAQVLRDVLENTATMPGPAAVDVAR